MTGDAWDRLREMLPESAAVDLARELTYRADIREPAQIALVLHLGRAGTVVRARVAVVRGVNAVLLME